jgi:hypothetical protein
MEGAAGLDAGQNSHNNETSKCGEAGKGGMWER